jgi:hypothetical protein
MLSITPVTANAQQLPHGFWSRIPSTHEVPNRFRQSTVAGLPGSVPGACFTIRPMRSRVVGPSRLSCAFGSNPIFARASARSGFDGGTVRIFFRSTRFSLSTVGKPSGIPSANSGIFASSARRSGGAQVAPSFFSSARS